MAIVLFFFLSFPLLAEEKICDEVIVQDISIKLSDTEKRLVCGDKETLAYSTIPSYQAAFFMQGFLQSRGYLSPSFKVTENVLFVTPGKKSEFKSLQINSKLKILEGYIAHEVKRLYLNETLTPNLLNDIESEAKKELRKRGRPCAEVESMAFAKNGKVTLDFYKTTRHPFGEVLKEEIPSLHENALLRYYPYKESDDFDETLLKLNEKRILRAEVLQGAYYLENCSNNGNEFSLSQNFLVGPPRTIRFGIGASTELGPMMRVMWSHNRFGKMASVLSAKLQGSFRSQTLSLMADSFIWEKSPRRSLISELNITRESQIDYEQLLIKLIPASVKWTRDVKDRGWTWILGPSLESGTFHSQEKTQTRTYNTVALEGSYKLMSHNYEIFDIHPEEGDVLNFDFSFRHPSLGFSDSAFRISSSYVKLARMGELGRGTLIGGARLSAGTLFIDDEVALEDLPPSIKFYGGGSDDIRGFGLQTLPGSDGIGALTKASLKLEIRKTHFFISSLESFLFIDGAYFGDKSFSTSSELFYSPGVGLRWKSPIGLIQGYWARAGTLAPNEDLGNFFYLGLGGVF